MIFTSRLVLVVLSLFILVGYTNCGHGFTSAASLSKISVLQTPTAYLGKNIVPVLVGSCGYINAPCVSVTICVPGTTSCKTIPNVLVDTGSTGLRVFKSVLTGLSLTNMKNAAGKEYGECLGYIGGTSDWGPIARADIQLASEKASNVPMQLIDSTFASPPTSCGNLDTSPEETGFNGILGVGMFDQDCGDTCVTTAENIKMYYACGTSCAVSTIPLADQVANPVARMPTDNNGVILKFPAVPASGAPSLTGTLILGIGTQTNNTLTGLTVLQADLYGYFQTVFEGKTYSTAFIDSGSNGNFFPQPTANLPTCSVSADESFYCPSPTRSFTATMKSGSVSKLVAFDVISPDAVLAASPSNTALPGLAGKMDDTFDWGFSFFLGRTVVTSIEGRATNMGPGPYWAF